MPEQKDREQHLYLLFDDWDSGYSIRKVSLSRRSGKRGAQRSSSGSGEDAAEPLPVPGVFMRVRAQRGLPEFFTSAFGTKIMVMHPGSGDIAGIPMIDVQEQTFDFGPEPTYSAFPIYFPVDDDRLFILDFGTFNSYRWMPPSWEWQGLPFPPFERADVTSYGVQPDGCLLVSTQSDGTFIFDTKESVWRPYSRWALPFTGRGHYDTCLQGFVGLSRDNPETLGYLYCSGIITTGTGGDTSKTLHPFPRFKRSKEKVYSKNPAERHVSVTLLHMRPGKFCLVECVSSMDDDNGTSRADEEELTVPLGADQWDFVGGGPQAGRFLYRVKIFSLGYDAEGDLKLKHCKVSCYSLPHEARIGSIRIDPAAFWL